MDKKIFDERAKKIIINSTNRGLNWAYNKKIIFIARIIIVIIILWLILR